MMTDLTLVPQLTQVRAPVSQADGRPAADTAALVRDATPAVPLPLPPGLSQLAVVTEARLIDKGTGIASDAPVERVMKPFGIAMLPESFEEDADQPTEETETGSEEATEADPLSNADEMATQPADDTPEASIDPSGAEYDRDPFSKDA